MRYTFIRLCVLTFSLNSLSILQIIVLSRMPFLNNSLNLMNFKLNDWIINGSKNNSKWTKFESLIWINWICRLINLFATFNRNVIIPKIYENYFKMSAVGEVKHCKNINHCVLYLCSLQIRKGHMDRLYSWTNLSNRQTKIHQWYYVPGYSRSKQKLQSIERKGWEKGTQKRKTR